MNGQIQIGSDLEVNIDLASVVANNTPVNNSGSYTLGTIVVFTRAGQLSKIKTYWTGPATTLKVSIWDTVAGGAPLATANLAISGAGTFKIPLAIPLALIAWKKYTLSVRDTNGLHFTSGDASLLPQSDVKLQGGPNFWIEDRSVYIPGDAQPVNQAGQTVAYPVTPIFTIP